MPKGEKTEKNASEEVKNEKDKENVTPEIAEGAEN